MAEPSLLGGFLQGQARGWQSPEERGPHALRIVVSLQVGAAPKPDPTSTTLEMQPPQTTARTPESEEGGSNPILIINNNNNWERKKEK